LRTTLAALLALSSLSPALGQSPGGQELRYVASHQVILSIQAGPNEDVSRTFVWASTDGRQTWQELPSDRVAPTAVRVTVSRDAAYDFYVVLQNQAGRSGPAPGRGSEPHASVIVDTVPPTLQGAAEASEMTDAGPRLPIRCSLIEEHLRDHQVRLFYQLPDAGAWIDGGTLHINNGQTAWPLPGSIASRARIRLVATDLAGNRATSEFEADLTPPAPARVAAIPPSASALNQPNAIAWAEQTVPAQPTPTIPLPTPEALKLLEQARRFQQEGKHALAVARLREAVADCPDSPDLLAGLGNALLQVRDVDQAQSVFRTAIQRQPDHRTALEGLALAAAAQNQYADARQHLKRLLELEPDTARLWLYYGDVEHRLGDKQPALEAWQKVLRLEKADSELSGRAQRRLTLLGAIPATAPKTASR
jgi:tetratricopeptide (TPR) repeat protein